MLTSRIRDDDDDDESFGGAMGKKMGRLVYNRSCVYGGDLGNQENKPLDPISPWETRGCGRL